MKKTLTVMTLLAGAVSVYSQGSVNMSDYYPAGPHGYLSGTVQIFTGQGVGVGSLVTDGAYSGWEVMGNTANTYMIAPGSTVYHTGSPLGPGYSVGLLFAAGNQLAGGYSGLALANGSVVSTWENNSTQGSTPTSSGNYGLWSTTTAVASLPTVTTGGLATLAIAAWQNTGAQGAANTLAAAQADGYAWGVSDIVTANIATTPNPAGNLPTTLTSFSLASVASVPEPSTIALGVIGASTLLFRRRK